MRRQRLTQTFQAILLSIFAVFALGFNHAALLGQKPMAGMEDMSDHSSMSSVQCQILCTTATKSDQPTGLVDLEENDDKSLPTISLITAISLSALAVAFVVKRLHLLSSWRPPDRILLYGHYSDGL